MKTRLVFSTETNDKAHFIELAFVPRVGEWLRVTDFLDGRQLSEVQLSARCWSGTRGVVQSVEYRKYGYDLVAEIHVWCED